MRQRYYIFIALGLMLLGVMLPESAVAQYYPERKLVRDGNEQFKSRNFANSLKKYERAYDEDDGVTLGSIICDEEAEGRSFSHFALRSAIEGLPETQRRLIVLRYFRDLSQTETARILGLTQVKVSREEKKIIETLRRELS